VGKVIPIMYPGKGTDRGSVDLGSSLQPLATAAFRSFAASSFPTLYIISRAFIQTLL